MVTPNRDLSWMEGERMEKELYLEINKKWFTKNAKELTEAHYARYTGEHDDGDKWVLDLGSGSG